MTLWPNLTEVFCKKKKKVLLEFSHIIPLPIVCDCFYSTMADLSTQSPLAPQSLKYLPSKSLQIQFFDKPWVGFDTHDIERM